MLRTLLIAAALLTASSASFAHDGGYGYDRVITVEPQLTISFGSRYPNGFRALYESGGYHYWTHAAYYPGETVVLPPRYRVQPVNRYRDDWRGWDDRRDNWHGEHRGHRYHDDD